MVIKPAAKKQPARRDVQEQPGLGAVRIPIVVSRRIRVVTWLSSISTPASVTAASLAGNATGAAIGEALTVFVANAFPLLRSTCVLATENVLLILTVFMNFNECE